MRHLYLTGLLGLAIVGVSTFLWLPRNSNEPTRLTISAGSSAGLRHSIALSLADFTRQVALDLEVVPTSGSRDALQKVEAGQLDLALIQGGLSHTEYRNVRQVAVLHVEPLHLLVKPDPAASGGTTPGHYTLEDLSHRVRGHKFKVNVSTEGSGTHALATELLNFFALRSGVDYEPTFLGYEELEELSTEELPDAVFTVSSLPSPVARHLISRHHRFLKAPCRRPERDFN